MMSPKGITQSSQYIKPLQVVLMVVVLLFESLTTTAQFAISSGANTINFDAFDGSGFTTSPAAGQLDSDD